ncbi:hypothetical protein ACLB2K_063249 [Fragaria x ananassa]
MGNEELNTASISVRGVLNTLAKNLNSDDPRPTITLGRGDPTEFAAFRGNEELNTASISVRGVLNTLAKNLNSDDPRPTITLGRGDPTEFAAFRTAPPAADAVSDALQSFKFNSYCPTGGVLEARRYVLSHPLYIFCTNITVCGVSSPAQMEGESHYEWTLVFFSFSVKDLQTKMNEKYS